MSVSANKYLASLVSTGIRKLANANVCRKSLAHWDISGILMNVNVRVHPNSVQETRSGVASPATVSANQSLAHQTWSGTPKHASAIVSR